MKKVHIFTKDIEMALVECHLGWIDADDAALKKQIRQELIQALDDAGGVFPHAWDTVIKFLWWNKDHHGKVEAIKLILPVVIREDKG